MTTLLYFSKVIFLSKGCSISYGMKFVFSVLQLFLWVLFEKSYRYRSFIVTALQYVWADGSAFVF
jgi:hypothetical protein